MPKKTFMPEQIVGKLRQIEVAVGQGKTVPLDCKDAGLVEQTFYGWRKEYGGLPATVLAGQSQDGLGQPVFVVALLAAR